MYIYIYQYECIFWSLQCGYKRRWCKVYRSSFPLAGLFPLYHYIMVVLVWLSKPLIYGLLPVSLLSWLPIQPLSVHWLVFHIQRWQAASSLSKLLSYWSNERLSHWHSYTSRATTYTSTGYRPRLVVRAVANYYTLAIGYSCLLILYLLLVVYLYL